MSRTERTPVEQLTTNQLTTNQLTTEQLTTEQTSSRPTRNAPALSATQATEPVAVKPTTAGPAPGETDTASTDAPRTDAPKTNAVRTDTPETDTADPTPAERVAAVDWAGAVEELNEFGCAGLGRLLTTAECRAVAALYDRPRLFRSTVDMARYRFGQGQYRYFAYPLPALVDELRTALYPRLLPVAKDWAAKLNWPAPWPGELADWLDQCHAAGQRRPTPILLRYHAGDWNALHRDLYGELVFPLQVVICLDEPGVDHTGGEFMLVEQRPRAQSKGTVRALRQGQALVFTTRDRPVRSTRGWSAAPMRHGVSTLLSGTRHTLGLVLHDAS